MVETQHGSAWSGRTLFTRTFLSIYDWFALGFQCRMVWQCAAARIVDFYNRQVTRNHLDIGAGTGYFLDRCCFPRPEAVPEPGPGLEPGLRLVLLDINPDLLARARKRLRRYQPQVLLQNVLEPLAVDLSPFDSIALTHLLHCLPGDLPAKESVFRHILPLLKPGGTLFGSTFLYQGVRKTPAAEVTFRWANRRGYMCNLRDSPAGLERSLRKYFRDVQIEMCGCEALFRAVK